MGVSPRWKNINSDNFCRKGFWSDLSCFVVSFIIDEKNDGGGSRRRCHILWPTFGVNESEEPDMGDRLARLQAKVR